VRFAPNGAVVWQKVYATTVYEMFTDVVATDDGGAIAAGYIGDGWNAATADGIGWVIRVDKNGNTVTEWKLDKAGVWDSIIGVQPFADGSLLVTGERGSGTNFNALTARLDPWGKASCAQSGACAALAAGSCTDSDPCTADACDAKGLCIHPKLPDGAACGAGKKCGANGCQ